MRQYTTLKINTKTLSLMYFTVIPIWQKKKKKEKKNPPKDR